MSARKPSCKPSPSVIRTRFTKPKVAVSMGDPSGIGPEVSLKAVSDPRVKKACRPILVGDLGLLRSVAKRLRISARIEPVRDKVPAREDGVVVMDEVGRIKRATLGKPSTDGGKVAGRAIETAVGLALSGAVAGIVTGPVSKESLALAGYGMVGHTELIARLTNTRAYGMMLVRGRLRVVFATTHLPLRRVARNLSRKGLVEKLLLTQRYLDIYMGIEDARIGIACLNPHCGEGGFLGREEKAVIEPAIQIVRSQGISVEGPYSADSIFRRAFRARFDAIVAMYHDQGMIPLKLGNHDNVVNITIGVPIVRTSPGHGTAFDIAGMGIASEESMVRAILECARISKRLRDAH